MIKYIEQEAAIEAAFSADSLGSSTFRDVHDVVDRLRLIPAADVVEVRRGEWLPDYEYAEYDCDGMTPLPKPLKFQDGWQCSLCGQCEHSETKYCPNCGAKMDGGEHDGKAD